MKSILIIPVCFGFFILQCCRGTVNKKYLDVESTCIDDSALNLSPFNKAMEKAINECISYVENEKSDFNNHLFLFDLIFRKDENDNCFLVIIAQPFYFKDFIIGYTYIDKNVIIYNKSNTQCSNDLVDESKLIPYQDSLPGFDPYIDNSYMPDLLGLQYQIINPDSLILIRKGMM